MTCRGRRWLRRFWSCAVGFWRWRGAGGMRLCVVVLLLTVPGCCWTSSGRGAEPLPVLTSLSRAECEGVPGVWMSSDDAGRLALWIYGVTGEDGS